MVLEGEYVSMQQKLRSGAGIMIVGALLAAVGEIVNAQNMDVLSSSWRLSLSLIVLGMLILLVGLATFGAVSNLIRGLGFFGTTLLTLGGLLLIIGTAALDWILLPFLTQLANTIAATINQPATTTQDELNNIIATINGLGGSTLQNLFPGATPHLSAVHIPTANGTTLVDSVLVQLNLPTIDKLTWWGHFCLSGGTLTLGSLILGMGLPFRTDRPTWPTILLMIFAPLNLLCQFLAAIPPFFGNITTLLFFFALIWIGLSAWPILKTLPTSSASRGDRRE
jgi:hypothetical protein